MFGTLALKSLMNRKGSVLLSILAMSVSIFVLLGVEHVRHEAKTSFAKTVSGVDLIVGARTGGLNLLLYSVFRIGSPTNNISWETYENIASGANIKWTIPISLGDSHKGYRVVGTTTDYFEHYHYGKKRSLIFQTGVPFEGVFDVVLGADVARHLGYQLGDKIVLAHGVAATSFTQHDEHPFTVVGVLAPTGTPVDRALHVSLQGIEAIHYNWQPGGGAIKSFSKNAQVVQNEGVLNEAAFAPKSITAFMVGLNRKIATFRVQREINEYQREPMLAILPGVALSELWQMMGILENTLLLVSALVFVSACLGICAMLLSSIRERGREIQLLRVLGASPKFMFLLIEVETLFITLCSVVLGAGALLLCLFVAQDYLVSQFGLYISSNFFSLHSLKLVGVIVLGAMLAAALPAFQGYSNARHSLC